MSIDLKSVGEEIITTFTHAPCVFCDYNGSNYYSAGTHDVKCSWHNVGGSVNRIELLPKLLVRISDALIKIRDGAEIGGWMPREECSSVANDAFVKAFHGGAAAVERPSAQHRAECDCKAFHGEKCIWPDCEKS